MKALLAIGFVASVSLVAAAQPAAVVTITVGGSSHNHYAGSGGAMLIRATLTWAPPGVQFANIRGSIVVKQSATTGSGYGIPLNDFRSDFPPGGLVNYGSYFGGSRVGMSYAVAPAFFTGGVPMHPSGNHTGIILAEYTVLTNGPTLDGSIEWVPAASNPNVALFPSSTSPLFEEVPTTYVGATFTAFPAPASLATLCGVSCMAGVRRRRA